MLEHVKCNLCASDSYDILHLSTIKEVDALSSDSLACTNLGHGRYHRIIKCRNCGLIYSSPRDKTEFIEDFYKKVEDDAYNIISRAREKTFSRALSCLERYKKGGRLLDIGCYTGIFMQIAQSRGWDVLGVEPSCWAATIAEKKSMGRVINCSVFDMDNIEGKFDALTMWDALEHFSDPRAALERCRDKLLDNGVIAISTMRCEGLFYNLCGHRWPWFMRMHLYYFTAKTISRMLEQGGFRIIHIRPYVHYVNPEYILYKAKLSSSKLAGFLKNSLFNRLIFPVQLGDFMEVYAVKK